MTNPKKQKKQLIVFDMDGVLVDVSCSYRDTTRQAARLFFTPAPGGSTLPDPLFSSAQLAAVKQSGGLNNDWDLTCAVIRALFSTLSVDSIAQAPDPWIRWRKTLERCDLAPLVEALAGPPGALLSLYEKTRRTPVPFVDSLYTGDVGSGNLVKQVFQEIYLGPRIFRATYGADPRLWTGDGFIHRESLIIEKAILEKLAWKNILAIATGRPAKEARYPLRLNGLEDLFSMVLSLDDCLAAEEKAWKANGRRTSLSKPNPWMLDVIASRYQDQVSGFAYVGDMPDDMEAARRSILPFRGLGVLFTAPDPEPLEAALIVSGARHVVHTVDQLVALLRS
jgi:phosphoglycolate phosphatase-like HAD superfamily hydrolase